MTDGYYDLGAYTRTVSTASREAQAWFDRGLLWCYGYNHDESVRCFERAASLDPDCSMAHWGVAYASGSNYNKPWEAFLEQERAEALVRSRAALQRAQAASAGAKPIERALITALAARYPEHGLAPGADTSALPFQAWNDAYATAMRAVYREFGHDSDVATLFAEALINRTPWQLWDLPSGQPQPGADTLEAAKVLEDAMAQRERSSKPPHPGLAHMYIHTMEMSPTPEKALRAADQLRDLVPDAGHLRHMASHIDVLCGHYYESLVANERAMAADDQYFAREEDAAFYTLYRCHNIHFKLYSAMFLGQLTPARSAVKALEEAVSERLLRVEVPPMADWLEGFLSMKVHALIRFGRWSEVLAEPFPHDPELYCVTTAMLRYARGVAMAATGDVAGAEAERVHFREAVTRVPASRTVFNNRCLDILAVASAMLDGELEYRKGNFDEAFGHLRRSVSLDDALPYDEPWAWMQPVRHALGALLLEQGQVEEALATYRDDLGLSGTLPRALQHPGNVWSLHGYVECLDTLGRTEEAMNARLALAVAKARADVPIEASCFCRLDRSCCD
ncbi:MAG TPA: hypothetical protein VFN03_10020 [Trueperaceae bacterium]|nr:hypothetical protein [Trueperaceae bacterium]